MHNSESPGPTDPDCGEVARNWSELFAGDLPEELASRLRAHVETCGSCAADHRKLEGLIGNLRDLPVKADLATTWSAISSELPAPASRRRNWMRNLEAVVLTASAVLLSYLLLLGNTPALQFAQRVLPSGFGARLQDLPENLQYLFLPLAFSLIAGAITLAAAPILVTARRSGFRTAGP